jgi:hypothetical protein
METIHYDTDDIAADYLDAHAYDYDDTPRREVLDPSVCSLTIGHDFEREDLTFFVLVYTSDAVLRRELYQALEPLLWGRYDDPAEPNPPRADYTTHGLTITLPNCFIPDEFAAFLRSHPAFMNTLRDEFAHERQEFMSWAELSPDIIDACISDLEDARRRLKEVEDDRHHLKELEETNISPENLEKVRHSFQEWEKYRIAGVKASERNLERARYEAACMRGSIGLINDAIAFLDGGATLALVA